MTADAITGTVRAAGDAVPDAEVVLFDVSGDRPELLATTTTDADGTFEFQAPADGAIALLARLTGGLIGVTAVELAGPPDEPVALDIPGPARTLVVTVARQEGDPESLAVGLEPDTPDGVPARLRPFINQRAPGVFAARFVTLALAGDELVLRLLPGRWRITGEFLDENRPNMPEPHVRNVVVTGACSDPDGTPLPGTETSGFAFDAERERRIVLALREVPDAEL